MAGFCDYGKVDQVGNEGYEEFMALYNAQYDGYAASHGFRTGDLITGIEVCFAGTGEAKGQVIREMREITGRTSDEQWVQYAQSCEMLAPGSNTKLRVRRVIHDDATRQSGGDMEHEL